MEGKTIRLPATIVGGLIVGALAGAIRPTEVPTTTAPAQRPSARTSTQPSAAVQFAPVIRASQFDLTNPEQPNRHALLALRVADADVAELAAIWAVLAVEKPWSNELTDLVMLRWTALDPAGAIAAAEKGGHPANAWWSWGCNDLKAALATARTSDYKQAVYFVLQAVAQNDPDRAQKLLEEFPEQRASIAYCLAQGLCADERFEEAMAMERQYGSWNQATLREWAAKDPEAALDWFRQNAGSRQDSSQQSALFDALLTQHPEKAAALLESLPPGALRYRFQEAQLKAMVASDPERASELARAEASPARRTELLTTVGRALIVSDPAKALDLFRELSASGQGLEEYSTTTRYPGGYSSSSSGSNRFIDELVAAKPNEAMVIVQDIASSTGKLDTLYQAADAWCRSDKDGLAAWLPSYEAGPARDRIVSTFIQNVGNASTPDFRQAAALLPLIQQPAESIARYGGVNNMLVQWQSRDPDDLRNYLAGSDVPEIIRQAVAKQPSLQQ